MEIDQAKARLGYPSRALWYSLVLSLSFHGFVLWGLSAKSEFVTAEPVMPSLTLLAFARKTEVLPEQWRQEGGGRQPAAEENGLVEDERETLQQQTPSKSDSQTEVANDVSEDDNLRFFDSLSAPAIYFFALRELDLPPYPLTEITGNIPELQNSLVSGNMEIELWVNDVGKVVKVAILKSDLPESYTSVVDRMLKEVPFVPAKRAGMNVCARIRFAMSFVSPSLLRKSGR